MSQIHTQRGTVDKQQTVSGQTTQTDDIQLEDLSLKKAPRNTTVRSDSRPDTLQKLHAQSSAETSGLGDSLLRMHGLSSTETNVEQGGRSHTTQFSPYASTEEVQGAGRSHGARGWTTEDKRVDGEASPCHADDQCTMNSSMDSDHYHDCESPEMQRLDSSMAWKNRSSGWPIGRQRGGSCRVSSNAAKTRQEIDQCSLSSDYEGRADRAALCSPTLRRSNTDTEGRFLGRGTQSAWLKWSHERRASFKRKVEFMERRQSELEKVRLSSPVRKARKESVRFVSGNHEHQHLSQVVDEAIFGHPAFPFDIPPSVLRKAALQPVKEEVKLTVGQWNTLIEFWEHGLFVAMRYVGLLMSLVAVGCGIGSIVTDHWSQINDHPVYGAMHSGLWWACSQSLNNCTLVEFDKWHIAVIGILMFSVVFDLMASVLAILGFCTSSLPKKIYFYHSAGESHFLCALASFVAATVYPLTTENLVSRQLSFQTFGYSYFLSLVTCACQCFAAFCMCLDDLVYSFAKGWCRCKRSSSSKDIDDSFDRKQFRSVECH